MFKDGNITIIGHDIITVMYVLLTLNMFLQAEKLLLNHCKYKNVCMHELFTDKKI